MRSAFVLVVMVGGVCAGWSCAQTCVPGKTEACACSDGRTGAQICRGGGTFEACVCTGPLPGEDAGSDAGDDAGVDCSKDFNAPRINWPSQNTGPARIAFGQPLRIDAPADDPDQGELDRRWAVWMSDGVTPATGVTVKPAGSKVLIEFSSAGSYVVELRVSDGCREAKRQWPLDVIAALRLPFAVKGLACCDAEGRAFVISDAYAEVVRLGLDGGIDATLSLPRLPRTLGFDAARARLVVGQDAYVTFIRVSDFTLEAQWPVDFRVDAVVADDTQAWVYGSVSSGGVGRALRAAIDGGVVLQEERDFNAAVVEQAFLSADGGWLVFTRFDRVSSVQIGSALERFSVGATVPTCGKLWEVGQRKDFITGCAERLQVERDGGLSYSGTLPNAMQLEALAETADGGLVMSWRNNAAQQHRLTRVDAETLTLKSELTIGLWASELTTLLTPEFLIPTPGGRVQVLTPDPSNAATWWQEF